MGQIVGAALVSHHPGLMQTPEFRIEMGNGADSDLIAGFDRLRAKIDAVRPDTVIIFDSHWFTTGYHLYDAGEHGRGEAVAGKGRRVEMHYELALVAAYDAGLGDVGH